MNTKQKLTLGIAAIFMVTLTIVGVTYAYFVTRVNYEQSATAVIQTASIGATFIDGKTTYLKDAIPGDKAYHLFAMRNDGETAVTYALGLGTYLDKTTDLGEDGVEGGEGPNADTTYTTYPEFVHTTLTDETTKTLTVPISATNSTAYSGTVGALTGLCYMSEGVADAMATALNDGSTRATSCYNHTGAGSNYDNITIKLWRLAGYSDTTLTEETLRPVAEADDDAGIRGTVDEFKLIDLSRGGNYTATTDQATHEAAVAQAVTDLKVGAKCIANCSDEAAGVKDTTSTLVNTSLYAPYYNGKLAVISSAGNAITIAAAETVAASAGENKSYNYYMVEITYVDNGKNQNIENDAFVGFKVDTMNSSL